MTITLHWWMTPITIFGIGFIWSQYLDSKSTGFLGSLDAFLILFASFIAAIFLTIGHFI